MALVLTIDAIDRTSVLVEDSLSVEQQAADFISICSLVLLDTAGNIAIAAEDDISVVDGATTFFAGRVVDIRYELFTTASRYIHIKCQDLNAIVNETVIDGEEVFTAEDDAVIIDSLFDDYLPAVDSQTFVATIQDPLTITFPAGTMLRSALSQICTRTGGYFYVDFDNALHYFDAEADGVAWWLSDDPDQIDTFSYFDVGINKTSLATTRLDGVYVIGDGVEGWRGTHVPGDRQAIARDNRITTATGRDERGDAILARYGSAQVTYSVSTYKAGLRAGMDIRFICALYGVDDTFTVRRMVVRWDKAGVAYYALTLGDVVNPSLISERNWTDTLPQALGPVTAPRLPTSSRGWAHTLVFSATDNDTVAWAAAGVITLADGSAYTIDAGNTGNMGAITYIYLDLDTSETVLQTTGAGATAVGSKKLLVAVAEDVAAGKDAIFQVFGGAGQGVMITADSIVASTITGNEINANSIAAGHIIAGAVETDKLDALAVTAAKIAANTITADKFEMGIGDGLYNAADGLLLLGPHCEITTTAWTSLRKQTATLSGAFHQEAGRHLGTRGLVVEEATTNRITNPSFEVDTAGWNNSGLATFEISSTYAVFGTYSLKILADGANDSAYGDFGGFGAAADITVTAWVKASHSTVQLRVRSRPGGALIGTMNHSGSGGWELLKVSGSLSAGETTARVYIYETGAAGHADVYTDGVQAEERDTATSYCDGTLGTGYAWSGVAHASISTRTVTQVNLDAHVGLISSNATHSHRVVVQMPYDADATWPSATAYLVDIFGTGDRIILFYASATDTFGVHIDGGTRLTSAAQTFDAGDWIDILMTLDFTADDYNLYVNGVLEDNDTTALTAQTAGQWNLGSDIAAAGQSGFNFVEYAVFDRVLTAIEVAGLYSMTRPMIDLGSLDKPGIYLLDGRFKIASSVSGNRIEIDADEIAGYDSGGTKQFYLRATDGKALAGGGAVVLDENGLYIVNTGVAGNPEKVRFRYDDAGTERTMGAVYGNWGGANEAYTWIQAQRAAGDPWTGAKVVIAAFDSDVGSDVRITVDDAGLITMGVHDDHRIGLGILTPGGKVHIDQSDDDAAIPVLVLDQADVSEEMFEFVSTIGAGNAIEAIGGKTLTTTHFIKVTLPGALTRYFPVGTIA